jgi:hypothetical protein
VDDWSFLRINTNGVVTNWSTIRGLNEEKKLCVVQQTTNGFTQGEMFFGMPLNGVIGKISADGTQTNLNWAVLTTNNLAANSLIRGSLYIDQTGIFDRDLIAVTGGEADEGGEVWRITSPGNATLLAAITNDYQPHLEGVITLPNTPSNWGPWAGKTVAGAESKTPPLIHTIGTNGKVASFALGIEPEERADELHWRHARNARRAKFACDEVFHCPLGSGRFGIHNPRHCGPLVCKSRV